MIFISFKKRPPNYNYLYRISNTHFWSNLLINLLIEGVSIQVIYLVQYFFCERALGIHSEGNKMYWLATSDCLLLLSMILQYLHVLIYAASWPSLSSPIVNIISTFSSWTVEPIFCYSACIAACFTPVLILAII
jgi:hypothetical protein